MIYVAILLCCATPYLLFFGERIAKRIRARRAAAIRQAWTADRIRAERSPARRTAWRMIRNHDLRDL